MADRELSLFENLENCLLDGLGRAEYVIKVNLPAKTVLNKLEPL